MAAEHPAAALAACGAAISQVCVVAPLFVQVESPALRARLRVCFHVKPNSYEHVLAEVETRIRSMATALQDDLVSVVDDDVQVEMRRFREQVVKSAGEWQFLVDDWKSSAVRRMNDLQAQVHALQKALQIQLESRSMARHASGHGRASSKSRASSMAVSSRPASSQSMMSSTDREQHDLSLPAIAVKTPSLPSSMQRRRHSAPMLPFAAMAGLTGIPESSSCAATGCCGGSAQSSEAPGTSTPPRASSQCSPCRAPLDCRTESWDASRAGDAPSPATSGVPASLTPSPVFNPRHSDGSGRMGLAVKNILTSFKRRFSHDSTSTNSSGPRPMLPHVDGLSLRSAQASDVLSDDGTLRDEADEEDYGGGMVAPQCSHAEDDDPEEAPIFEQLLRALETANHHASADTSPASCDVGPTHSLCITTADVGIQCSVGDLSTEGLCRGSSTLRTAPLVASTRPSYDSACAQTRIDSERMCAADTDAICDEISRLLSGKAASTRSAKAADQRRAVPDTPSPAAPMPEAQATSGEEPGSACTSRRPSLKDMDPAGHVSLAKAVRRSIGASGTAVPQAVRAMAQRDAPKDGGVVSRCASASSSRSSMSGARSRVRSLAFSSVAIAMPEEALASAASYPPVSMLPGAIGDVGEP